METRTYCPLVTDGEESVTVGGPGGGFWSIVVLCEEAIDCVPGRRDGVDKPKFLGKMRLP
jgi:hypothetical protein